MDGVGKDKAAGQCSAAAPYKLTAVFDQPHLVEPIGPMRMQVEFYDSPPRL